MAYVENVTIHDADAHVMEMPDKILEFIDAKHRNAFEVFAKDKLQTSIELQTMTTQTFVREMLTT